MAIMFYSQNLFFAKLFNERKIQDKNFAKCVYCQDDNC